MQYNTDMAKIITLNGVENKNILNDLFDNDLIVFEDIQGSKIWVNWDGKDFTIKPKSMHNEPINLIDLAMQNYYNPAINFFTSLDVRVKSLLNKKWWFCFEYFPDNQPANIEYSRVPKNNLVLTSINKNGKYDFIIEELDEYARLFDVDILPVVFQGKLTERMIEAIKYFINTSEEDLDYVFGEKSFAFFFYKILNPSLTETENYKTFWGKAILNSFKIAEGDIGLSDPFSKIFFISDGLMTMLDDKYKVKFARYIAELADNMADDQEVPEYFVENELRKWVNDKFLS